MDRYYITDAEYEIAASNGISRCTLNNRVRSYGWNIEKAINEPLHYQFLKGMTEDIKEKLKKNKISRNLFFMRVKLLGWNIEEAATTPPLSRFEAGKRAGEKRRTVTEEQYKTALKNGISDRLVRYRTKRLGWTIEKAITEPVKGKRL